MPGLNLLRYVAVAAKLDKSAYALPTGRRTKRACTALKWTAFFSRCRAPPPDKGSQDGWRFEGARLLSHLLVRQRHFRRLEVRLDPWLAAEFGFEVGDGNAAWGADSLCPLIEITRAFLLSSSSR